MLRLVALRLARANDAGLASLCSQLAHKGQQEGSRSAAAAPLLLPWASSWRCISTQRPPPPFTQHPAFDREQDEDDDDLLLTSAAQLQARRQQHDRSGSSPPPTQRCKVTQYVRGTDITLRVTGAKASDFTMEKRRKAAAGPDGPHKHTGRSGAHEQQQALAAAARERDASFVQHLGRRAKKQLQATFLPAGYPDSVGKNYLQYTAWQAVTNIATTANGVLASTFLLYSVGLGAGAIPTAGALNWVLKDGLGQVGTLLFGKQIAHNFDIHSKSWYFLSFVLLSTATGLEIATILAPAAFLTLGSVANMIKGLSWMAGGSTRSVFNLTFARDNNIADITAKNTSQYIFASLFGTAVGVSMCAYIGQSAELALTCFTALTVAALYAAFRTVKSIPLPTLNSTRLQLLTCRYLKCISRSQLGPDFRLAAMDAEASFHHHAAQARQPQHHPGAMTAAALRRGFGMTPAQPHAPAQHQQHPAQHPQQHPQQRQEPEPSGAKPPGPHTSPSLGGSTARQSDYIDIRQEYSIEDDDTTCDVELPSPLELAEQDPPLPWLMGDQRILNPDIRVGALLEKMVNGDAALLVLLMTTFKWSKYLLMPANNAIHVVLHQEAAPRDIVQAYLHACILRLRLRAGLPIPGPESLPELRILLHDTLLTAEKLTSPLMRALSRQGWQTEKIVVEAHRRRARW